MLPIAPQGNHLILCRLKAEAFSAGGIAIPDTCQDQPTRGLVLAVGDGYIRDDGVRETIGVAVGDEILYSRDHGTEVQIDGVELTILKAEELLAVVEV